MRLRKYLLRLDDAGAEGGGTAAATATTGAAATGAATTTGAAATGTQAATAATGTTAAATGTSAAATTGAAATTTEVKATWPDNWRETVSKDDAKRLTQLQRYQSPEAAIQALFAAQDRIRSGELKPVLSAKASPEELKEWREAHGIPETPDKYDLKDVKIDAADKPMVEQILKAAHGSNQTPEQVKAVLQSWNAIKKSAFDAQAASDQAIQTTSEDTLRAEWGGEFRRNMNLIHGLLDGAGSQDVKDKFLAGRLSDGTPIGSSPEVLKMLVGLALIQNPTGVVVPGGDANRGEGIQTELEKLQKIPTAKKTEQQSERERALIDAALKGGHMNADGTWKK